MYFEQDGRFALLFLSGCYLLGFIVNILLFGVSPMALWAPLTVAFVPLNMADLVISLVT